MDDLGIMGLRIWVKSRGSGTRIYKIGIWVLKELSLGLYDLFRVMGLSVRASGLVVLERV